MAVRFQKVMTSQVHKIINTGVTLEVNYPRGRHQTCDGKTNFQQTRLKISWLTVTVHLAPHIKQERTVQTKPNRINVIFQCVLL